MPYCNMCLRDKDYDYKGTCMLCPSCRIMLDCEHND